MAQFVAKKTSLDGMKTDQMPPMISDEMVALCVEVSAATFSSRASQQANRPCCKPLNFHHCRKAFCCCCLIFCLNASLDQLHPDTFPAGPEWKCATARACRGIARRQGTGAFWGILWLIKWLFLQLFVHMLHSAYFFPQTGESKRGMWAILCVYCVRQCGAHHTN